MEGLQKIPRLKEITYSYSPHSPHSDTISGLGDDELTWIEGEHELTFCTNVNWIISTSGSDDPLKVKGTIILSNFRLRFLPEDAGLKSPLNKLLSKFDVVLYDVNSIYKVKKKKRKLLLPDCLLKEKVETLELVCKSFQTVVLDLQSTSEDENNRVIYLLIEFVVAAQTDSLMVYARPADDNYVEESNLESYWSEELKKCGETSYRAVTCNESFHVTDSLPKTFVVPSSLSPKDVVSMATKFVNNRSPCWTYSCRSSGTALIRMSYKAPGVQNNVEEKVYNSIRSSHPYREYPKVFDLSSELPSLNEVQTSFTLLQQLCIYDSTRYWGDVKWHSQLENCRWLEMISRCLNLSRSISAVLSKKHLSVIIREYSSTDLSPLVASLVQLMLEEDCRTMKGFQGLVKKEWLAQGHKFGVRLQSKTFSKGNDSCPVFLLFLDCVHQLLRLKPEVFEFNSNYLVLIWHSTCQGLFRDLLFNSPKDLFYTTMKIQMEFSNGTNLLRRNQQNRATVSSLSVKKHPDSGVVGTLMRKSQLDFSTLKKQMSSLTNLSQSHSMFSPALNDSYASYDSYSLKKSRSKLSRFSTLSINSHKSTNQESSHNFSSSQLHLTPTSTCSDWSEFSTDLRSLRKSSQSHLRLNSSQILNHSDVSYENPWTDLIGEVSRSGATKLWDWTLLYDSSQMLTFNSFDYLARRMQTKMDAGPGLNSENLEPDKDGTLTRMSPKKFQKSALILKGQKIYNYTSSVREVPVRTDFLEMNFSVPCLSFWFSCYLRFHPSFAGSCIPIDSSAIQKDDSRRIHLPGDFDNSQLAFVRLVSEIRDLEKCLDGET